MRLPLSFYERDVLIVAPELIGKVLIRNNSAGTSGYVITEVEAYNGSDDQASHARFGLTKRNSIMFGKGGFIYMYFIYGMYWMMNIVTGNAGQPQAILIRGIGTISGPGRVTKMLGVDRSFNGENLTDSQRIWIEDHDLSTAIIQRPRFGIDYADEPWKSMPWRYIMVQPPQNS